MTPLHSILVPIDGSSLSKQAIPYARALVGQGSGVLLLQVVPEEPTIAPAFIRADGEGLVTASGARESLQGVATEWADSLPIPADVCVKVGEPADTILNVARARQATLIIMTTHGYGAFKRVMFGSVTDRVVRHAPVPVLVGRPQGNAVPGSSAAIRRIVVPLDGSARAEYALSVASTLAQQLLSMVLVRALHISHAISGIDGPVAMTQQAMNDMMRLAEEYLVTVRDRLPTGEQDGALVTG